MFKIEFTKSSGIESRPIDTTIIVEDVSKLQYKSGGSWQQHHHIHTTTANTPTTSCRCGWSSPFVNAME